MKIFPGMHYTMGGLWVDFNQQTNIPGVFAAGEADYSIHGANRLGANSLLSCIYGGFVAGPAGHALRQDRFPRRKATAATPPNSSARRKRTTPSSTTRAPKTPSRSGASSATP